MPPILISQEGRRRYINLLGDYTLAIGQISKEQNIIKPGKEYNALKKFFLSQWQTTLKLVQDFKDIQSKRTSDHVR